MIGFIKDLVQRKKKTHVENDATPQSPRFQTTAPIDISHQIPTSNDNSPMDSNASKSGSSHSNTLPDTSSSENTFSRSTPKTGVSHHSHIKPAIQIMVNNSSGFQIGDTFNLSMTDSAVVNFPTRGLGLSHIAKSMTSISQNVEEKVIPSGDIEDVEDVVSEDELRVISDHVEEEWESLGLSIGLSQGEISVLKNENPWSHKIAVLEMLHEFVSKYPETSVGFLAAKLRETGHTRAVNQLKSIKSK